MKSSRVAAVGTALVGLGAVEAATPAGAYVGPGVTAGTPIAANYTGPLRPQVHYSPPKDFMNDPNGCFVDANGTWHLYYQYNPTDVVAGNQHWGHATSKDLYHWDNQPIALFPPDADTNVFSGSAVTDPENTSGFFPDQDNGVVAIYTLNTDTKQTQNIAYSYDGGYSFIPYENNPVIDSETNQFRDPKVIKYEDTWVMVAAFSQDFVIAFYTSKDLKTWEHASNFSHHGLLGTQYECPNLQKMPIKDSDETKYVLTISINPGAPLGGSIMEYFPGDFNGTHFTPVDNAARIADFAKDNYAGQFFYGVPENEPAVSIAWASNWQYTQFVPTADEGWRSVMSLPRVNYLTNITRLGWDMVSLPYDVSPILGDELTASSADASSLVNKSLALDFSTVESNALYFNASVRGLPPVKNISSTAWFNFTLLSPVSGESLSGGYQFGADNPFFLDRGRTRGFDNNPFFTDKASISQLLDPSGTWSIAGLVDRSIFEVFLDGGIFSGTATFFPTAPLTIFSAATGGLPEGAEVELRVWGVKSAWASKEDENGTVKGNVTADAAAGSKMHRRAVYDAGLAM
ncbi:glycosyl hydrolase [Phyllosticta capitalensis]|uniref:Glycosyl hydrolase n=1 Tax=Phyllosticta capitalensis TaxID=121624 RepID=A0ABR1YH49_9PEZI